MIAVLIGLAVFYFTSVLLFTMEHVGPYASKTKEVATMVITEGERGLVRRPADLFDYLRLAFGAYTVSRDSSSHEVWIVHTQRMAVWQCPHCLGFWIALVFALFFSIIQQNHQDFFLNWWAAAGVNSLIVRFLNRES